MASPFFLGVDLSAATYTWSAGANASYPVSNLATYFSTDLSKSNATTDAQYITIDLGSATACNTIVLHGYNGAVQDADSVDVILQGDDNSGFTSPETIISAGNWNMLADTVAQFQTFTSATYRYWRIKFDKGSALGTVPQFGNIFLGTRLQFESTYEWDFAKENKEFETAETVSLNGNIRTSQAFTGRKRWDLLFRLQSNTLKTSWNTFTDTVRGKLRPFYFVDADGTTINYVHLDSDFVEVKTIRYNQNNLRIPLKAQVVS